MSIFQESHRFLIPRKSCATQEEEADKKKISISLALVCCWLVLLELKTIAKCLEVREMAKLVQRLRSCELKVLLDGFRV
jgi:hypothetical protein